VDRRIRISIIVVVVVALAYPAAAWLLGLSVEHQWNERERLALERVPYLAVIKRDYRRGVYSSTEELTYGLGGSVMKSLRATGHADWTDHAQFTVRNTIHHGPLPRLRAFAPATVDTDIVLPPDLHEKLSAVLGSQAGLSIHTRMKWLGGSTTVIHSNPVQRQVADGGDFAWRGLDARIELGREFGTKTVDLGAPGLTFKGPSASLNFENLKINFDAKLAFDTLNIGTAHATLGHVDIEAPAKDFKASAQNLTLDSKTSVDGDYVSSGGTVDMGSLQVGKFVATKAGYAVRLDHVHGPSAAALTKSLQAAQTGDSSNATPADYAAKFAEAFKTSGTEILAHDPVLEMPRIGFTTPDGELLVSLKATLPGITRADLDVAPDLLKVALVKHLQASLDVRIDTALLDKLLDSTGKGDTIAGQLQGLQRQGYIKLDGKALTTHLAFQNGQLKVNDLPFPPMPAGGPGMPVPPGSPRAPH
jgi:uncharacterized protein YdgA (DUF945 family)